MFGNGFKVLYQPNFLTLNNATTAAANPEINLDLIQLFVQMTVAGRWDKNNSWGVGIIGGRQRFGIKGLAAFDSQQYSAFPGSVTDKQFDYANGSGYRLGWMGTSADKTFTWGASYCSKIRMGKFEEYKGLFAEEGGFDVPKNYAIGIAVKTTPAVTVAFDVEKIFYSDIPSVGNRGPVPNGNLPIGDQRLGLKNGAGFGWWDGTYYKLGLNYEVAPGYSFRIGYNRGHTTIPDDQLTFNMLAPATVEQHYTLGMTYDLGRTPVFGFGKESALTFSYVHAFRKKQSGPTLAGEGLIEMYQDVFEGALNLKF
jgi:long-chain fatty acid transport protein